MIRCLMVLRGLPKAMISSDLQPRIVAQGGDQVNPVDDMLFDGLSDLYVPTSASVNGDSQVNTGCREEQVVGQHPKPLADIQGRKKSSKSRGQVEVRERVIQYFR